MMTVRLTLARSGKRRGTFPRRALSYLKWEGLCPSNEYRGVALARATWLAATTPRIPRLVLALYVLAW